jgi:hypothetical protein
MCILTNGGTPDLYPTSPTFNRRDGSLLLTDDGPVTRSIVVLAGLEVTSSN